MRIVVIGGTRFIGPHVVRTLAEKGHRVIVFHRGESEAELPDSVEHVHGDRMRLPGNLRGDLVIDMWCMTEPHAQSAVDHFRTERLLVMSSGDAYRQYSGLRGVYDGPPDTVPLGEDAPLRETFYPYRFMSRSEDDLWWTYDKVLVERIVAGERTTILRLPAVYGPHDEQHRFASWIASMDAGEERMAVDVRQATWRWTRGYVENVADAVVLAALDERAAGRTFNVGEPDAPTEEEWVGLVARATKWAGRTERAENVEGTPPLHFDYHLVMDTNSIRRDLGYRERVARPDAIARTVQWERVVRERRS